MSEDTCPHCGWPLEFPEEPESESPVDRVSAWCVVAVVDFQRGTLHNAVPALILERQDACGDDYHEKHKTMEADIVALRGILDALEMKWKGEEG